MNRVRNFSKTISLVCRMGRYQPTNEKAEEKIKTIGWPSSLILNKDIDTFKETAKARGYDVMVFHREIIQEVL